ncbi:MAG: hypothetical protein WBQ17_12070 [Rhizomicrobium sp.]
MVHSEDFDFISNFSTVWQVFLGAILATIGGFAATQIEWYFERKRRERDAALLFGELLATLGVLLTLTHRTYGVGDPFGPITVRLLRSAKRELDIYDRNREKLYDIRDARLRAGVHTLVLRINTPLEGVFDAHEEIAKMETQVRSPKIAAEHREELLSRIERLKLNRTGSYEAIVENTVELEGIINRLEPYAQHQFRAMRDAGRSVAEQLGQPPPQE